MVHRTLKTRKQAQGAALLVLLAILGLAAVYMFIGRLNSVSGRSQQDNADARSLTQAKEALLGYAATYRDTHANEGFGFMPCPAEEGDGKAELTCDTSGYATVGLLPFRTLDLTDLRDSSGNCLWYVVSGATKYNPKKLQLNWDSVGQFTIKDNAGNVLASPSAVDGGPVALIIAPHKPLGSQSRSAANSICGTVPNYPQFIDSSVAFPSSTTLTLTNGTPDSADVNDRISWLTTKEIFNLVTARSDFPTLLNSLITEMVSCLDATHPTPVAPSGGTIASIGLGIFGRVPMIPDTGNASICTSGTVSAANVDMWRNWQNQFRYADCGSAGCVTVGTDDSSCRGVLLFGGQRSAAQAHSTEETQAAALDPLYLDGTNATHWRTGTLSFTGATVYAGTAATQDIAICIQ